MGVDIRSEQMEHIEIFGKPALFTNERIDRSSVPDGWHCYDLRGSDDDPGRPATLEDNVCVNHAGAILSPFPLKRAATAYRRLKDTMNFLGEDMSIEEFCAFHEMPCPQDNRKYILRPASLAEAGLFFSQTEEQDREHGCVGHVRFDHGSSGGEFWSTWWSRGTQMETGAFWEEHKAVMEEIGQNGPLHDRGTMARYCAEHPETALQDSYGSHGFKVETDQCCYYVRCDPRPGDYSYIYIYDRATLEMSLGWMQAVQEGPQMKGL